MLYKYLQILFLFLFDNVEFQLQMRVLDLVLDLT